MPEIVALFHRVVASVPAYRDFLRTHGVDPAEVRTLEDFHGLPLLTKENYHRRYPLPDLCRDGKLGDMIAVSSGSSGEPTIWPRSAADEAAISARFLQVLVDGFRADERTTLAVVCFPLGTWVGGLFTLSCLRHLSVQGNPITSVAPGNNKAEILRVIPELGRYVDQVVLLGYPPFVKDVIDSAPFDWGPYQVKLVLAGEVFSEEWRSLVGERAAMADPVRDSASLYGTADAGVLGNETPFSVSVRRFLAADPGAASELFGSSRLPTLVQYDPASRYFEAHDGRLVFSGDNGIPLIRYGIADEGGVLTRDEVLEFCARHAFTPEPGPDQPFVYVFGRSLFTVSFFGANVYPENVTVGLEQPGVSDWVTGKFVLETVENADRDTELRVTVELAPDRTGDPAVVAESIRAQLVRLNSEFAHYVPAGRQLPHVELRPAGDPEYFPVGVKHRWVKARP
jgi:phenylacetate-CoA ligase